MAKPVGQSSEIIMRHILAGTDAESSEEGPAVISCGGIYIPHKGARQDALYHIITTQRNDEPVKVVTGVRTKNVLHELIMKESMN